MSADDFSKTVEDLVDGGEFLRLEEELRGRSPGTRAADLWVAALGVLYGGYPHEAAHYARLLHGFAPEDPSATALLAHLAYLEGDLTGAEALLRSALVQSESGEINRSEWVTQLGEVLLELGRFEECELLCRGDWTDLVGNELTPTIAKRAMLLARHMVRLGRWSEASAYCRTALRACRHRAWAPLFQEAVLRELSAVLRRNPEPHHKPHHKDRTS